MRLRNLTLTIIMIGLGVTTLWAQPCQRRGLIRPNWQQEQPPRVVLMEKLKLTEDQEKQMQKLRLQHQKEMLALENDLRAIQLDLKGEMLADQPNTNKVNDFIEKAGKIRIEMQKMRFAHRQEMRKLLTDEQKKIWDQHQVMMSGKRGSCFDDMEFPGQHLMRGYRHRDLF